MEEPDFPYPIQKDNRRVKWALIISVVVVGIVGGIVYLRQPKRAEVKKVIAVEYKQLSNSPTSKPAKKKSDVTIQVLNGTGKPGQAGLVVKTLQAAGYNSENIKSGNAETTDHEGTTITSRADFGEIVNDVKDVLKPMFPDVMDGISNLNPNEDSGFDIVIITGNLTISPTSTP